MTKSAKAGILIAILVIPALSFVFLKLFGKNEFNLPYYFPELDDKDQVVMVDGDTLFQKVEPFTLVNQQGDSSQYQPGKITIVNFFFSRCGTICPITNTNLMKVADVFKQETDVEFLGITVDPKFDTPEVLHQYARALNLDHLNYQLLTGDKKYIYDLCLNTFRLPVADASEYDTSIKDIDEMFIHSDKAILLDKEGHFRGFYTGTQKEEMERLKVEIKVLLNQDKK